MGTTRGCDSHLESVYKGEHDTLRRISYEEIYTNIIYLLNTIYKTNIKTFVTPVKKGSNDTSWFSCVWVSQDCDTVMYDVVVSNSNLDLPTTWIVQTIEVF